jgi:hypothetical protein
MGKFTGYPYGSKEYTVECEGVIKTVIAQSPCGAVKLLAPNIIRWHWKELGNGKYLVLDKFLVTHVDLCFRYWERPGYIANIISE